MPSNQLPVETQTILIVEDDESTGFVMEMAIAQETPYHSRVARNGREALQAVQECKPQLIIMDYRLPDITGVELYDRLHSIHELAHIPFLLVSATRRREDIEPRDIVFLEKPFELDNFLQTIERLIICC